MIGENISKFSGIAFLRVEITDSVLILVMNVNKNSFCYCIVSALENDQPDFELLEICINVTLFIYLNKSMLASKRNLNMEKTKTLLLLNIYYLYIGH